MSALNSAQERIAEIEVDRLRVKPLVKVTGEFFAQTTEGDGNFHMFEFLEREGAEIKVEPIANWIMYLLWQAKAKHADKKWLNMTKPKSRSSCSGSMRAEVPPEADVLRHRQVVLRPPVPPLRQGARRHRP